MDLLARAPPLRASWRGASLFPLLGPRFTGYPYGAIFLTFDRASGDGPKNHAQLRGTGIDPYQGSEHKLVPQLLVWLIDVNHSGALK